MGRASGAPRSHDPHLPLAGPAPPHRPRPHRPRWAAHYDVAVVGAGLTGLTRRCCWPGPVGRWSCSRPASVGYGTTGRSTAKISCLQGTQLSTIAGKHAQLVVEQYVEAQREAWRGWSGSAPTTAWPCSAGTPYTYANGAAGERSLRQELEAAAGGRAALPSGWTSCRCRSPRAERCGSPTSSRWTRWSCSTALARGRPRTASEIVEQVRVEQGARLRPGAARPREAGR